MKKSDYRNHLDSIRCSEKFRAEMEKRLTAEKDGEYEDSVSDIEYAPKINYHRLTALVASLAIIIGISGIALLKRSDIFEISTGSDITESSESSSVSTEISSQYSVFINTLNHYNIDLSISENLNEFDSHSIPFGSLPDEAVNEIIENFNYWTADCWEKLHDIPSDSKEATEKIILSFTGDENFILQMDSNGNTAIKRDGEEDNNLYYPQECYLSLLEIIARYIPYCDWNTIIGGDMGDLINTSFRNHIDEIETVNNYNYEKYIEFFDYGIYSGAINENGNIIIYYNNREKSVWFKFSPELYEEIYNAVNSNFAYIISQKDTMFYSSSTGQVADYAEFQNVNTDILCEAIKSLDWCISDGGYPSGEFFAIGNFMIKKDGSIYNSDIGLSYIPTNQNNSEIINAIEEMIKENDFNYISYLAASSENRFDTMSGNIYYSCKDFIDGAGKLYYDNKNKNEYVYIEGKNSNSVMLRMESNLWTEYRTVDNVTETADGSGLMERSEIDYGYIRSYFLAGLINCQNALADEESDIEINSIDITKETDYFTCNIEYVSGNNCTSIRANIDSLGNIVYISIFEYDVNTDEINQQMIFYIGNGNGEGISYNDRNSAEKYNFD